MSAKMTLGRLPTLSTTTSLITKLEDKEQQGGLMHGQQIFSGKGYLTLELRGA